MIREAAVGADQGARQPHDEQGAWDSIDLSTPRAFKLDPTGTWLYKGDRIVQFAIDQQTGELTPTGNIAEIPTPVSLVFTTSG